ncbi:tetratricopeptide repeat protein [Chamaesiphon sp. VAR_48_metabat_403]|uniref:tetratricopeptide repeat-containing S1 family peptidase n=1 Tax=Chamaesiphon sp. VAR_48_metabat_403 TaxID=2964700 RepID=UPI00286D9BCC|nr:tetratricopeptide repeat protein [Chamaesiphon sp. VAR_48_metabat_403]
MSRSSWFLTAALVGTQVVLVQPAVMAAKSAAEVQSSLQRRGYANARAVTVEIKLQQDSSVGSGIIIARSGDLYTIATNRHVVCGKGSRKKVPTGETYELGLADGQKYRVTANSVKLIGTDLDLAIVQFRSSRKYPVAQLGTASALKVDDVVYTAGFPLEQPGFSFNKGEVIAAVDKRITGDRGGYSVVYDAFTLPGMSGGGVFDRNGQLVAIHGQGERYSGNTDLDDRSKVGSKIGYNRGIPVRWLVPDLAGAGISISGNRLPSILGAAKEQTPVGADEYFIAGFNKFVEPGEDVTTGKRTAIQELSKAIRINPRYTVAYFVRAYVYEQLQEFRQSLIDYNRAIVLNPQGAVAYNNRGNLKQNKLNDIQGALADFNRAIALDPENAIVYANRGNLKNNKLNDIQSALADYDRAIALNPQDAASYTNRGNLKGDKLNDIQGALADYDRAIALNPQYALAYYNRGILKNNKLNDIQGALADYDRAITLNPKHAASYINRGKLKHDKLNDSQGALADFDRAITLNPQYAIAYNNRGVLKKDKLNDSQGALVDLDRAIALNPQDADAYYNRGNLKQSKLNDSQGALADYNRAVVLNSQSAKAYGNRGILKRDKLNDKAGAIQDFRQAAKLFRTQGQTQYLQMTLDNLRQLGATERSGE